MSTGKRLAKRSILGTRVASLGIDGYYYPGMIQAMKTQEDGGIGGGVMPNRYSVRFDDGRRVVEFLEKDIIGPGFEAIGSVQLQVGQTVYVTHCQREIRGIVVRHDFETQDVIIKINEVSKSTHLSEPLGIQFVYDIASSFVPKKISKIFTVSKNSTFLKLKNRSFFFK